MFSPFHLSPVTSASLCLFLTFHLLQLKQMKELEQEKDSLLAGLEVVERARDWYQGQIHNVTERQRQVGQSPHCTVSSSLALKKHKNTKYSTKDVFFYPWTQDFITEASQSRMNVLIPKLQDVNRCLNDLISCPGMVSVKSSNMILLCSGI